MKTQYFTIADGPVFGPMGAELKRRYKYFNGIDLEVVSDADCLRYGIGAKRQYWMKAFLWCLADPDTDRICYVDADILPIAPLPAYVKDATAPFSARLDVPAVADNEKQQHVPLFSEIKAYFNNGFFIATCEAFLAFERLKQEMNNPIHAFCIEQTWLNKYVDETCGLTVLPNSIAYIVDYELEPENVIHRHYCAHNKLPRFEADMVKFPVV